MTPSIFEANKHELDQIAHVHKNSYGKNHFTSLLPLKLLADYYGLFICKESKILILKEENKISGFIVFGRNIPEKINHFKKNNKASIFFSALRNPLSSLKILFRKVKNYKKDNFNFSESNFILLSIASASPGKKIGFLLMKAMIEEASYNKESKIGLYVNINNLNALNLYLGFDFKILNIFSNQFYMELKLS